MARVFLQYPQLFWRAPSLSHMFLPWSLVLISFSLHSVSSSSRPSALSRELSWPRRQHCDLWLSQKQIASFLVLGYIWSSLLFPAQNAISFTNTTFALLIYKLSLLWPTEPISSTSRGYYTLPKHAPFPPFLCSSFFASPPSLCVQPKYKRALAYLSPSGDDWKSHWLMHLPKSRLWIPVWFHLALRGNSIAQYLLYGNCAVNADCLL